MSILSDDGHIIDDEYQPSEAEAGGAEYPADEESSDYDTTTATATDDTISGGEGADYVYGADGNDIILSGFSIGHAGFWF